MNLIPNNCFHLETTSKAHMKAAIEFLIYMVNRLKKIVVLELRLFFLITYILYFTENIENVLLLILTSGSQTHDCVRLDILSELGAFFD